MILFYNIAMNNDIIKMLLYIGLSAWSDHDEIYTGLSADLMLLPAPSDIGIVGILHSYLSSFLLDLKQREILNMLFKKTSANFS